VNALSVKCIHLRYLLNDLIRSFFRHALLYVQFLPLHLHTCPHLYNTPPQPVTDAHLILSNYRVLMGSNHPDLSLSIFEWPLTFITPIWITNKSNSEVTSRYQLQSVSYRLISNWWKTTIKLRSNMSRITTLLN